jgi:alkylation response protein AidB-like acyl-CoA dehydrogenase
MDWLSRVEDTLPVLREQSDDIERHRELTAPVLAAMHGNALFRMSMPKDLMGGELPVPALAEAAELVATADASSAWCLGQGLGCAMSSAFLDADARQEVFGPPDSVLAWGAGIQGRAVATDGGYRVSGTWRFASGSKHATWLGAHSLVFDADGSPRLGSDGKQSNLTCLLPRSAAVMHDDWYVMGLKGTRSESYTVTDLFVPEHLTLDREVLSARKVDSPLYKFPTTNVYASMFSGVALGIARAMLDELIALSQSKTARGARTSMQQSPVMHTRLAELEAQLGSARAYQRQTISEVWDEVASDGEITLAQRARIRLATTYAINEAALVGEQTYRLAGSTAIFENQSFERRFRDLHAVSQQVQGRHTNFETVGRYLVGLEVDTIFL